MYKSYNVQIQFLMFFSFVIYDLFPFNPTAVVVFVRFAKIIKPYIIYNNSINLEQKII